MEQWAQSLPCVVCGRKTTWRTRKAYIVKEGRTTQTRLPCHQGCEPIYVRTRKGTRACVVCQELTFDHWKDPATGRWLACHLDCQPALFPGDAREEGTKTMGVMMSKRLIQNTSLERGRKSLLAKYSMADQERARSPLTAQLYATLDNPDSYVKIPLGDKSKSTMLANLAMKAKSVKGVLKWTYDKDERILFAWLVKASANDSPAAEV